MSETKTTEYILIALVVAVAIWQITSILNLKSVIATEKDNNTQGILFAVFGVFFYGLLSLLMLLLLLQFKPVQTRLAQEVLMIISKVKP